MAFKDCVQNDIHGVFLDLEFFGEQHRIEGRKISIVIDNDKLKEKQGGQDLAVAESDLLFYARSVDLPPRRPAGESLNVDGRDYIVDDWQDDMGMATVVLRRNVVA